MQGPMLAGSACMAQLFSFFIPSTYSVCLCINLINPFHNLRTKVKQFLKELFLAWKKMSKKVLSHLANLLFAKLSFCQLELAVSSTCSCINLTFDQQTVLSTWHLLTWHFVNVAFVNLTFCQLGILSTCSYASLIFYKLVKSTCYFICLSFCQADRMSSKVDEMSSWQNVKLTKCQVDKMSSWQNVKLTKCQIDKMSIWQNVELTKCQVASW